MCIRTVVPVWPATQVETGEPPEQPTISARLDTRKKALMLELPYLAVGTSATKASMRPPMLFMLLP